MVMKMDKSEFIKLLEKKTGYTNEECIKINEVLEDNFIIGKKNKEKIIEQLKSNINLNEDEASKLYETCMSIISSNLKDKIKHPFKGNE